MASIQETDRQTRPWRVRWREAGRQRSKSFAEREEAERYVAQLDARQAAAVRELKPNLPFERYSRLWLRYQAEVLGNEASTIGRAETELKYVIGKWAKDRRWTVAGVTPNDLRELMAHRRTQVSPETAAKTAGILRALFRDAQQMGFRLDNPASSLRARLGKTTARQRKRDSLRIPTSKQVAVLLAELAEPAPMQACMLAIIAYTGARPSEALGLRWQDIDRPTGNVFLGAVPMVDVHGVMVAKDGAKTESGSERSVPLLKQLWPWLELAETWRDERQPHLVLPGRWTKAAAADGGRSISLDHARRLIKKHATDPPAPYDLRHHYASILIASGAKPFRIKEAMGHARISMVYDTYGHLLDPDNSDLAEALEAELDAA